MRFEALAELVRVDSPRPCCTTSAEAPTATSHSAAWSLITRATSSYECGRTSTGCASDALGCGVVFKLSNTSSGWQETVIHTFQHTSTGAAGDGGGLPWPKLTFDSAGDRKSVV